MSRWTLCLLAGLYALCVSAQTVDLTGFLQVYVITAEVEVGDHQKLFWLERAGVKSPLQLLGVETALNGDVNALFSGQRVMVSGYHNKTANTLAVKALTITAPAVFSDYVGVGQTLAITSITFIVAIGSQPAPVDVNVFRATWLDGFGTPARGRTMQQYHSMCSYGKVSFTSENNMVVGPINIPWLGSGRAGAYDSSRCGAPEIYGWFDQAEAQATAMGIDITRFTHRVMMMPVSMPACGWAGLGSVGCSRSCYTWIKGTYALQLDTPFHELGHNLGLQHSTTPGSEYGDCSCAMGGCNALRCYNAPQSWKLGWSQPVGEPTADDLPIGLWVQFYLPPFMSSPTNLVRLTPSWQPFLAWTSYFFSFRQPIGGDSGIDLRYTDRISVHQFAGKQGNYDAEKPQLVWLMDGGTEWPDGPRNARVRVKYLGRSGANALMAICRIDTTSGSECTATMPTQPPKPPPPPSPQPPPPPKPRSPPPHRPPPRPKPPPPKPRPPPPGRSPKPPRPPPPPPKPKPPLRPRPPKPPPKPSGRPPKPPVRPPPTPTTGLSPPPAKPPSPYPPDERCPTVLYPRCGDGACDAWNGESCKTCPQDCPGKLSGGGQFCCGGHNSGCSHPDCNASGHMCRMNCPTFVGPGPLG